MVVSRFI